MISPTLCISNSVTMAATAMLSAIMLADLLVTAAGPIHHHRFAARIGRHWTIRKQDLHREALRREIPVLPER
jgi:hypothetical protein